MDKPGSKFNNSTKLHATRSHPYIQIDQSEENMWSIWWVLNMAMSAKMLMNFKFGGSVPKPKNDVTTMM